MNALIVGIDSNIGRALSSYLQAAGWTVWGTSRRAERDEDRVFFVDLQREETIANITGTYDVIYVCIALTNIKLCETNPALSEQINYTAQVALAKHCLNLTSNYVFLSTSGVFDGKQSKPTPATKPTPSCVYGQHKVLSEEYLLQFPDKVTIVRTTKVITPNHSLISGWKTALQNNEVIEPFNDMNMSPMPINQLLDLLKKIGEKRTANILHISGAEDVVYSTFAQKLAIKIGAPLELIKPKSCATAGIATNTIFKYSSLGMQETTQHYGLRGAGCEDVLNEVNN